MVLKHGTCARISRSGHTEVFILRGQRYLCIEYRVVDAAVAPPGYFLFQQKLLFDKPIPFRLYAQSFHHLCRCSNFWGHFSKTF